MRKPFRVPFELRMAARYVTTRRREGLVTSVTVACTAGVFVGVAALVLALAFMNGLQGKIRDRLRSSNPHVVVWPSWGSPPFEPSLAAAIAGAARELPEVVATAPFAQESGLLVSELQPRGQPAQVKGIDPEAEDAVTGLAGRTTASAWRRLVERGRRDPGPVEPSPAEGGEAPGPLTASELEPPEAPPVLLGEDLALALGVVPGELVHLVSARPELTAVGPTWRRRAFRTVGSISTGLHEYDRTWAVVHVDDLRPGGRRLDGVQVAVARPLEAAAVAEALAERVGRDHVVTDWTTTFSRLFAAFRWEKVIMLLALGLIGVVAGFNILTILTMNVLARVADVGVLSALGARPAVITRVFVWMGLAIGGAGTFAGVAAGALGAYLLDRHRVITLDESVYLVSHVPFVVEPTDLVLVALGMLLVSSLAALLPARTAATVDPVVALRSE